VPPCSSTLSLLSSSLSSSSPWTSSTLSALLSHRRPSASGGLSSQLLKLLCVVIPEPSSALSVSSPAA